MRSKLDLQSPYVRNSRVTKETKEGGEERVAKQGIEGAEQAKVIQLYTRPAGGALSVQGCHCPYYNSKNCKNDDITNYHFRVEKLHTVALRIKLFFNA